MNDIRETFQQRTPTEDTSSNRASALDKAFLKSTGGKGHSVYNKKTRRLTEGTASGAETAFYNMFFNTLRTGDADLRLYITTVQDG